MSIEMLCILMQLFLRTVSQSIIVFYDGSAIDKMSFAFGFSGDDIENESDNDDSLVQQVENYSIDATPLIQPKRHSLQELVS